MTNKTTEQDSSYDHLEAMSVAELLQNINREDQTVAQAVNRALPQIIPFVEALVERMEQAGRLFYTGAGTSGRLGVVDASECPPTFGVAPGVVVGVIAGGDEAIRQAVEGAEDNVERGWKDLKAHYPIRLDTVIGLSASGTTPYVIGAVREARKAGLLTACITCNAGSPLAQEVDFPIEVVVGPEFVTGSTRMKAGSAQKMILNMISTAAMIRLGHVSGNKMVDMQLTNTKLVERGIRYVANATGLSDVDSQKMLMRHGSVRAAVGAYYAAKG